MTPANWISIVALVCLAVGAILKGMTSIITRLLDEKWRVNNERLTKLETNQEVIKDDLNVMDHRMTSVEALCDARVRR
jgi:hypothetical protein